MSRNFTRLDESKYEFGLEIIPGNDANFGRLNIPGDFSL